MAPRSLKLSKMAYGHLAVCLEGLLNEAQGAGCEADAV